MENMGKTIEGNKGWINETDQRSESFKRFLDAYFEKQREDTANEKELFFYDSMKELHFSGMNTDVLDKIKNKKVAPEKVEVFREGGEITQIHAVYNSEGKGHNIDVYIKGEALEDYLNQDEAE